MSNKFDILIHQEDVIDFSTQVQKSFNENFDFEKLIYPLKQSNFFLEYWEQKPLIISRADPDYYLHLISLEDVELLLNCVKPDFHLVKNGQSISHTNLSLAGSINNSSLYNAYAQGNTIVLSHIHNYWKPVSVFGRNLETYFNHLVHINVYLTPKNSQGFLPHFDTHDVFILQITGAKLWRIYDSFLPLPSPINDTKLQVVPKDKLGTVLYEVLLNPGDLLYVPRGYVHEALTSECSSLHLTVGIDTFKWTDLISHALALVSEQNVSFRKSLPVGFLNHEEIVTSLKHQFKELLEILLNSDLLEKTIARQAQQFIKKLSPIDEGHFTQIDDINLININSIVAKRRGIFCHIVRKKSSVSIEFPGNKIEGPTYIEPALRFIAASEAFPIRSIPDTLTDNGKLVLVRRLVREGLLTTIRENALD